MRRTLAACIAALALTAGRADALTIRDVIELSRAGLGEPVLLALIEVDHSVFAIDAATLKALKDAGVSDNVIVALIRSGREAPPAPPPPAPDPLPPEPTVVVIDHHDAPPSQPVYVPVYVPVVQTVIDGRPLSERTVRATIATDHGLVNANVPVPPNCVKADPVYWGFGGKLRPGSWEPAPTVVCR